MSLVETTVPPDAPDAEEALLGYILIDPQALLAARTLKPENFSRLSRQVLFATMRQLEEDGIPVDVVTVTTRLERTGQLERAGGSAHIGGLLNAAPAAQNPRYYVHLVRQIAESRQAIQPTGDLASRDDHSADLPQAATSLAAPATVLTPAPNPSLEEARARLAALAPTLVGLDNLLEADFSPTLWIVPNLLPEGLTLLAAKPKLGKSWLALGLAIAVASGGVALGKIAVEPGDVLYLALEDSPRRLHLRGRQFLGDQPAPARLEVATSWPKLDEGGLSLLKVWLQAHPDARLIILDTLVKIRGHARSATPYAEDYASLEQVQQLAHDHRIAILVIHHTGKESREDPLDEVNATQGLTGVADNILVLRRERGKPTAILIGDGRELTGIELSLQFDLTNGAWTITEPEPDGPKTPERAEILDLLKASAEPMSPTQIAKALGKNISTINNLLPKMVRDGNIKLARYGKYIPVETIESVESVESSHIQGDEEESNRTIFGW